MNLVLIGYRGTGKSVVGKILADRLNMKVVNMDAEIVKLMGLSIPEIVEKYGWDKFRDAESEVAEKVSKLDNVVVDTGGGVIERPENIGSLKANGLVFWLSASVDVIVNRIKSATDRPALTAGKTFTEEISEVLQKRIPKYQKSALYKIETDHKTPLQTAKEIIKSLNVHQRRTCTRSG